MKYSIYKKLSFSLALLGAFSLFSCGGSSGGDEEEFEFKPSDLTNKYWYANPYRNQNFTTDDALLVYKFNGNGDLVRQDYGGRRDNDEAGTWTLSDDNTLTIDDKTTGNVREYTIDKSSASNHLFLKSSLGNWDFYADFNEIQDVTVDAAIVKEVVLSNGSFVNKYRYDFEIKGEFISQAKVILETNSFELVKSANADGEVVWRLKEADAKEYFETFKGEELVKFYVKMNSGEEFKFEDRIEDNDIEPLNVESVDIDHNTGSGPLSVTVEWKAIDIENAYYYVQILNADKDENNPLVTSNWQPEQNSQDGMQSITLSETNKGDFGLKLGDLFYVKVVAFLYEDGINPYQGDIHDFNKQAKSQYIRSGGEW
ncbi:hypothetical protein [Marinifilum flexuosum]|uniref:hypothetical protein n=1 Tax=Marinifilum flexuosum TaxID=1117708 RepID=UPI002494A403|nr:hypothetical protein [Marinifilum flexuosum]